MRFAERGKNFPQKRHAYRSRPPRRTAPNARATSGGCGRARFGLGSNEQSALGACHGAVPVCTPMGAGCSPTPSAARALHLLLRSSGSSHERRVEVQVAVQVVVQSPFRWPASVGLESPACGAEQVHEGSVFGTGALRESASRASMLYVFVRTALAGLVFWFVLLVAAASVAGGRSFD